MNSNRRWLKSILITSRTSAIDLPWQSSVRNRMPDAEPVAILAKDAMPAAARPPVRSQAQAAR